MAQKYVSNDAIQIKPPKVEDLNNSLLKQNSSMGQIGIPSLEVYQPDFGALQTSMDDILKSFEGYKQATTSQFDANKASLDLNLEQSIRNIGEAGQENQQAFTKGRQQVSEDIYSANRANTAQMSARGLGGSGVEALANLQTRMQAGETVSDMAGEFFDAQEKLVQAETDTREKYNVQLQNLNSSLQGAMAQIMSQEASTKMDYTQMVDNLKRQVVADMNASKQAQYEWQTARSQLEDASKITNTMVQQVLESDTTEEFKVSALKDFGYSDAQAKLTVAQQKAVAITNQGKVGAEQTKALQAQIDNLIAMDYSEKEIKSALASQIPATIDASKLNFGGTPATQAGTSRSYSDADLLGKQLGGIISGETIGNSPYIGIRDFFTKKER